MTLDTNSLHVYFLNKGYDVPVERAEICQAFMVGDRRMRLVLEQLRAELKAEQAGETIVENPNGAGYVLTKNKAVIERFYHREKAKGLSTLATASNCIGSINKREAKRLDHLAEQMELSL